MARVSGGEDSFFVNASPYVRGLDKVARGRYKEKLAYNEGICQLPDPYALTGWTDEMKNWPDLSFGDIYIYVIETPSIYDKKSMKAYKSLDAYNYFASGHVKTVWQHVISEDSPFTFLKSEVIPSQRINEKQNPWVCLLKANGEVQTAHCDCMAGLGEVCSHAAALLFKVEAAVKLGLTTASSTSEACAWNRTYREKIDPIPLVGCFTLTKTNRTSSVISNGYSPNAPLPALSSLKEFPVPTLCSSK